MHARRKKLVGCTCHCSSEKAVASVWNSMKPPLIEMTLNVPEFAFRQHREQSNTVFKSLFFLSKKTGKSYRSNLGARAIYTGNLRLSWLLLGIFFWYETLDTEHAVVLQKLFITSSTSSLYNQNKLVRSCLRERQSTKMWPHAQLSIVSFQLLIFL